MLKLVCLPHGLENNMKLTENLEKYGHSMHLALKAILKDLFDISISDQEARRVVDKLSLSDVLHLDSALQNQDEELVRSILGDTVQLEYSLPGRASISSVASTRQSPTMRPISTTNGTKPNSQPATVATGKSNSTIKPSGSVSKDLDDAQAEIDNKQKEIDDLKKKAGIK